MTTEEGNKLIYNSPFGKHFRDNQSYLESCLHDGVSETVFYTQKIKYHSSWDWLMPVVEKVETNYQVQVHIQNDACWIKKSFKPYFDFSVISDNSKIEAVWLVVIEFAKFHNRQNSQPAENQNVTQP